MRLLALFGIVVTSVAGLVLAAPDANPEPLVKGFAVHEWGVFSVSHELATANADRRAELEALPGFIYGQTATRHLPMHEDRPASVRKPVVFFHAPQPMEVKMSVQFPGGTPLVWWPATESPAINRNGFGSESKPNRPVNELTWRIYLQKAGPQFVQANGLKEIAADHWIKALREVKSDMVYVGVGRRGLVVESEQFVYYDGLIPCGKSATVKFEKDRVLLTNEAKYTLFDVTAIDRRSPTEPRLIRVAKLDAGATREEKWKDAADPRWPEKAARALQDQLKDAGLNDDEAKSLAVVWTREFFDAAGVTLFYRLPQEEYERLLPLTLKPRPEKLVRVGLVHLPRFEPGLAESVAALVKLLDDDEFLKREAAQRELEKLGRAAFPHLAELRPKIASVEARRRVDELLEKYDTERITK